MSSSIFNKTLTIEVLYMGTGEQPFVCAINGRISMGAFRAIEKELREEQEYSGGAGLYLYEAKYDSGQYDEFGRCEIRPGWELTQINHNPNWMLPEEGEQP